jgi:hydrogenase-4 component F
MDLRIPILVYSILLMPMFALAAVFIFRHRRKLINLLTILFSLLSLLASIFLAPVILKAVAPPAFEPLPFLTLRLDSLSIYFVLLVNLVAFLASIYTIPFLNYDRLRNPRHDPAVFHIFLNLFHITMLLVPMVDNLVALWIAVELTTIFSTVLVRYQRSRLAIEASWKFMMITTTGIIFALLGTLFLTKAVDMSRIPSEFTALIKLGGAMRWSVMANPIIAKTLSPNFVMLSFLFVMIGYGTKAGLAPMHTWLPDGHGEAPSPVSALLSGVMLKSALYAILRFYTITNLNLQGSPYSHFASTLLIASGLFSLVLATPFILKKNKFKRVLAYHSLEHMGIIAFGIGVGTPVALFGALLHTLNHALTKALMFLVYGTIQYEYLSRTSKGPTTDQDEMAISGVLRSMPFSGTILGFGGLALVGSPPFSIFMSEFIIIWAAIQNAFIPGLPVYQIGIRIASIVLFIVTVTLIFGGLVGHLSRLLLGKASIQTIEPNFSLSSIGLALPFLCLILILLAFGINVPAWPVDLPQLLEKSVQILQKGS